MIFISQWHCILQESALGLAIMLIYMSQEIAYGFSGLFGTNAHGSRFIRAVGS